MPRFDVDQLRPLGEGILRAAGATEEEARVAVDHCSYAHLAGEDNHGMEQVVWYPDWIAKGLLKPAQQIAVERESETTLLVNGNLNFGHHVSDWTMRRLIEKANRFNVAAGSIRFQTHVGRLIDYTAMAAREGMIALMARSGSTRRPGRSPGQRSGGRKPRDVRFPRGGPSTPRPTTPPIPTTSRGAERCCRWVAPGLQGLRAELHD
jgi:uncharacterized oxidoreductase